MNCLSVRTMGGGGGENHIFVCLNRSTELLKVNFEFVKSYRKYRSGNVEDIYGQQWLIQLSVIISLLRTGSITIWMGRAARRLRAIADRVVRHGRLIFVLLKNLWINWDVFGRDNRRLVGWPNVTTNVCDGILHGTLAQTIKKNKKNT